MQEIQIGIKIMKAIFFKEWYFFGLPTVYKRMVNKENYILYRYLSVNTTESNWKDSKVQGFMMIKDVLNSMAELTLQSKKQDSHFNVSHLWNCLCIPH